MLMFFFSSIKFFLSADQDVGFEGETMMISNSVFFFFLPSFLCVSIVGCIGQHVSIVPDLEGVEPHPFLDCVSCGRCWMFSSKNLRLLTNTLCEVTEALCLTVLLL